MTHNERPFGSVPAWSVAALSHVAAAASSSSSSSSIVPFDVPQDARYVLGPRLGQGGMGRVYSAWDRRLGRDVAFKEVLTPTPLTEGLLLQEATLTAELDHPAIVPIYDAGRTADGRLYYTMRLVRGRSLRELVRELWRASGASQRPSLAARLAVVRHLVGAGQAVAFSHARQIVHRDLKPDNILVGPLGEVQVADWGLACRLAPATTATTTTATTATKTAVVGTPGYQAPEVLTGAPTSVAVDVYALGSVLHEVLVGVVPTPGVEVDSDAPEALWAIAQRALQPRAADRYADAAAFVTDLQAFFDDGLVQAHSEGLVARLRRLARRHRAAVLVGVVVTTLSAAALAVAFVQTVHERDRAVDAERRTTHALSTSLLAQAQQAFAAERAYDARAIVEQVQQLARDNEIDDPQLLAEARGIVAALTPRSGRPMVQLLQRTPIEALGCDDVFVPEHRGDLFACRTGMQTSWRSVDAPTRATVVTNEAAAAVAFDAHAPFALMRTVDDRLVLVSLTDGSTRSVGTSVAVNVGLAVDVEHGVLLSYNRGVAIVGRLDRSDQGLPRVVCSPPTSIVNSGALVDGRPVILCSDGTVRTIGPDELVPTTLVTAPQLALADLQRLDRVTAARVVDDGFLLGTLRGELLHYVTAREGISARVDVLAEQTELGVLNQLLPLSADVEYLVGGNGAPMLAFHQARSVSADVGRDDRGPAFIDRRGTLHTFGRTYATWTTAADATPRTVVVDEGLTSIDVDNDGAVVVSGANGLVVRVDRQGHTARATQGLRMTVKQATLIGDHALTAGIDAAGPQLWPAQPRSRDDGVALLPELRLRRAGVINDGTIWALGFNEGPWWFQALPPVDAPTLLLEPVLRRTFVDGRVTPLNDAVVALDNTGMISKATPSSTTILRRIVGAADVAVGTQQQLAVAIDARIEVFDGDTLQHTLALGDDRATDVVIDDRNRWVIAGTLHGEVMAWQLDSGALVVKVQQHTEQVGAIDVVTRDDGAVVVMSAGWDHRVRSLVLTPVR